jgi:hypothetical protein
VDRYLAGTPVTLEIELTVGGTPTDPAPDAATIEVLRGDGSVLVPAGTAAADAGAGRFNFTLSPAQTLLVDDLTARWTYVLNGAALTTATRAELAGGFLFTLAEARRVQPLNDPGRFPNPAVIAMRTLAEQALEDARATSRSSPATPATPSTGPGAAPSCYPSTAPPASAPSG